MGGVGLSAAVLGPLQVTAADRVLGPRDWGGRKPKQVLEILLVHQGQPVPKDRIVDLLWGARPPRDPMRTVEAYVSGLRARLGPGLARTVRARLPAGTAWSSAHPDNARYLATHIPGARLVELDGADHWPWFGDTDSILCPLEDFLDRLSPGRGRKVSEGPRATLSS